MDETKFARGERGIVEELKSLKSLKSLRSWKVGVGEVENYFSFKLRAPSLFAKTYWLKI